MTIESPKQCMLLNLTKKQKNLLGYGTFFLLIVIGLFIAFSKKNSLESHISFTKGQIYNITTSSKSPNVFVHYRYHVGQKQYKVNHSLPKTYKSGHFQPLYKLLLNRTFLVAYDSINNDNSQILVAESQYKRYKIARPDSLKSLFQSYDRIVLSR